MSQASKPADGKTGHLSAEGTPATTQFDTSLETDNGSISKNTIQNAAENTVNSQVIYNLFALCYSLERLFLICS